MGAPSPGETSDTERPRSESRSDGTVSPQWQSAQSNNSDKNGDSNTRPRTQSARMVGDFIRAGSQELSREIGYVQGRMTRLMSSKHVMHLMAAIVLIDAYCNCADIDARAEGSTADTAIVVISNTCLVLYTVELVVMGILKGTRYFKDGFVLLDLFVVICGYTELILSAADPGNAFSSVGVLRVLRLVRIIRLLRLLRRTRALRELQKLVIMMSTCLKALLWSFVFCFVIMTIWAMLMVELVQPLVSQMGPGQFGDCADCVDAMSSVMLANLLLFKTVIAGDSWGQIAVPVITAYPATAIIFVGSLLTLVFGVLNLIVAVVVDTFADARDRDILNLAEEMEQDVEADKKFLEKMFNRIDKEGSGQLSLEQLVEGARKDAEFQSRLRVMDIDEVDLQQLFDMIDTDGSGTIEAPEFIRPLSRWVHDSKTAPRFIKYNLMRTMHQQDDIIHQQLEDRDFLHEQFGKMTERIDRLCQALIEGDSSPLRMRAALGTTFETSSMCSVHTTQDFDGSKRESMEREIVEQPHLSKRVLLSKTLADAEGSVKLAMERLEQRVLSATEGALKQSTAVLETLLLEAQCGHAAKQQAEAPVVIPVAGPVAHTRITIEDVKDPAPTLALPRLCSPLDSPQEDARTEARRSFLYRSSYQSSRHSSGMHLGPVDTGDATI